MRVLVSGSSGLIGSALSRFLSAQGHEVLCLVRPHSAAAKQSPHSVLWDSEEGILDASQIEDLEAVVHLAGESIAAGRWTTSRKQRILDSRVKGTTLLSTTLSRLDHPPRVLISASAIGYYGSKGDQSVTEDSSPGAGFLSEVCRQWEAATEAASIRGIRVVNLRLGMVLSATGGALARMLFPFKLGLGGRFGNGAQPVSWIALDDVVGAIYHGMLHDSLSGPVNATSPFPVSNREFTRTLGQVLSRPTFAFVPAFAARLAFGEMADELLLGGSRVLPAKLLSSGYSFQYPRLEEALRHLLKKN